MCVRVQLLSTKDGIPVEFVFLPGSANDVRGLKALPLNLPEGSQIYGDSAYTDYTSEDDLIDSSQIELQVMRKKNSTRQDPPWTSYVKQSTRHYIETVFSGITRVFPKSIHAVTLDGFLLKLSAFIFAFTLKTALSASLPSATRRNNGTSPSPLQIKSKINCLRSGRWSRE